jgi:hypothetical protein
VSDHAACFVYSQANVNSDPKQFKFINFWTDHPKFMQLVSTVWSQEIHGFPMFSLYQKLKSLKAELKKFNKDLFGGLSVRVQKARDDLERRLLLCPGHSILLQLEKEKNHCFMSLSNAEESFMKQKSRNNWLNLGDQNTALFHRSVKVRSDVCLMTKEANLRILFS